MEKLNLTQEWDKVFPKSDKVDHKKVTFHNRYGITLAADMYTPRGTEGKLPAIAVSGPFGAVKEQSSGLYAQKMAELGFLTISFDPSYTGESGGMPRYVASPDINTEDFCAAVDFLSVQENVDPERIGIIGICGWGGMAINAAAIDTRIKATAAMTMYDMTRVTANGYFDAEDSEQARYEKKKAMNAQRTVDYKNGTYALAGGVVDPLPEDVPQFVKDYYAYYKTPRGYHSRSLNSNGGWNVTSSLSFLNMPILQYSSEIRSAVLLVHGEKAHSRYFSETAYSKLTEDNKEFRDFLAELQANPVMGKLVQMLCHRMRLLPDFAAFIINGGPPHDNGARRNFFVRQSKIPCGPAAARFRVERKSASRFRKNARQTRTLSSAVQRRGRGGVDAAVDAADVRQVAEDIVAGDDPALLGNGEVGAAADGSSGIHERALWRYSRSAGSGDRRRMPLRPPGRASGMHANRS